jgi:hypothetical protein
VRGVVFAVQNTAKTRKRGKLPAHFGIIKENK